MTRIVDGSTYRTKTNWLRLATIAVATLILCSCRSITPSSDKTPEASREFSVQQSLSDAGAQSNASTQQGSQAPTIQQVAGQVPVAPPVVSPAAPPSPAPTTLPINLAARPLQHGVMIHPHAASTHQSYAPYPRGGCPTGCPCGNHGDPRDGQPGCYNWCPPPMACPWSEDEYLCDGGDQNVKVAVNKDWTVRGLNLEDTVVHYDTLAGETEVSPSNQVCIYAPRFAAVRKVYGIVQNRQATVAVGFDNPTGPLTAAESVPTSAVTQPLQPNRILRANGPVVHEDRQMGRTVDNTWVPRLAENVFAPYEDLSIIRRGVYLNSEKARLANLIAAALVWTGNQAAQVMVEDLTPIQILDEKGLGQTYVYDLQGKPRVRILKIASKKDALPGEIVDFTLRFDNVGDQPVGNVTVIDNLTTRLEYVEGSQQCSLKADFLTQVNEGESLVLRWEITEPLKVKEGGIIRFKCRVR